jgi:hypothetical protein
MTSDEWIKFAPSAVGALTGIIGVLIAVIGFTKWRREMHGRGEFDLARRTLLATYKLTGNIRLFAQVSEILLLNRARY